MSGRHRDDTSPSRLPRAALMLGAALTLVAAFVLPGAGVASASAKTVNTQLSLSGLASADNPLGGDTIGIHPGDAVSFKAAGAPTAGLDKLGLGGLVNGLLDSVTAYQVTADFSKLGGSSAQKLRGSDTKSFRFAKTGTYSFTWTAQNVTLLGAVPINLDGNQLKDKGVALNAENQYVGKIVVSTNPPKGGLGIQLPKTSVHPKVGGVQLPKVSLPGATTPKISTPDLPSAHGGGGKTHKTGTKSNSGSKKTTSGTTQTGSYQVPGLSVPDQVVPNASSGGGYSSGLGGYYSTLPNGTSNLDNDLTSGSMSPLGSKPAAATTSGGKKAKPVDLAADPKSASPSSQLPVILAILAIIALALVAGTYARLYLLRKPPTA